MLRYPAAITGIQSGTPYPQGATYTGAGTNFALYSESATQVELCLYADESREQARIALPARTDNVWHGFVPGIGPGQRYGYRVHGPFDAGRGLRFNPKKLLIDPYALALDRASAWHPALQADSQFAPGFEADSAQVAARSVVVDREFDWQDDRPPRVPWSDTLIYECHVKGLTQLHPEVPAAQRGRYAGLAAPAVIAHLKALGVSALELLPVQQAFSENWLVQRGLINYWGYNSVGFFAPDARYAAAGTLGEQVREFKVMVAALHRAGIEVILDVVYNHSGEADALGPTLSLRGIDNAVYYRLDPRDRSFYPDTTGCGNSLNFDHPQTQRLVMDSLRYWVTDMHVDGFRFDLAPTLARGDHGLDLRGRFFSMLAQDPVLAAVKLIVEPWDVGYDGVRTGDFAPGFSEWNDRYRDTLRRYYRGDGGMIGELATRLAGSSDLFERGCRGPFASINYIASHDGRSLRDLVSYETKHNQENGWDNRDGPDQEYARNWGQEGPTDRAPIAEVREQVIRSWLLCLACSQGVPMLRQGDEFGATQRGNNNAYPQDNEVSWIRWQLGPSERALLEFARAAFALRRERPELRRAKHFTGAAQGGSQPDVSWLHPSGVPLGPRDFQDPHAHAFGMWIGPEPYGDDCSLLLLFNGGEQELPFQLPAGRFEVRLDTAAVGGAARVEGTIRLRAHSALALEELSSARASVQRLRLSAAPDVTDVKDVTAAARPVARLDRDGLRRLATHYGIADGYVGYHGDRSVTSDQTRVTLLTAMGLDVSTPSALAEALRGLEQERERPGIEPVRVQGEGADALRQVELRRNGSAPSLRYRIELALEGGHTLRGEGQLRSSVARVQLPLPLTAAGKAALAPGYHTLRLSVSEGQAEQGYEQQLIVTPRSAPSVRDLLGDRRGAGVWAHVYALHRESGLGLGDLGDLRSLLRLAADRGLDFVGINPLHAVDNLAPVVSPYYPLSRVFGNPLYIDVENVPELAVSAEARALLQNSEFRRELAQLREHPRLNYARAWRLKQRVLTQLYAAFQARGPNPAFAAFQAEHGRALDDFAAFCAIAEHLRPEQPVYDFEQFPAELRDPQGSAVAHLRERLAGPIGFQRWLQFELERQLREAQRDARARGMPIGIYADLAVGNAPGGADVWSRPDSFARGVNLGAPPDPYSATGQTWGLSPLLPQRLRQDGYRYFRWLCKSAVEHAGLLRVDHVMGLLRQFWVPNGESARSGAYVRFPFEELCGILALEAGRARTLVVGEDLGVVPEGLRERMAELSLLRSQVLCFERDQSGRFLSPQSYAAQALATVNTHDMPPLLSYFDGLDLTQLRLLGILADDTALERMRAERAAAKAALLDILRSEGLWPGEAAADPAEFSLAVHALLAKSSALLAAGSLDDMALEVEPLNVPGVASAEQPSWAKRMRASVESLSKDTTVLRCLAVLRRRSE